MADKKKIDAKNNQILADLLNKPENRVCCECGEKGLPFSIFPFCSMNILKKFFFFHCNPGPRWASWNLGCFFCLTCAGIHRRLGTHISKVKSVTLDSWTPEQIEVRIAFYKILFSPPFRRSSLAESKSGSFCFVFFH